MVAVDAGAVAAVDVAVDAVAVADMEAAEILDHPCHPARVTKIFSVHIKDKLESVFSIDLNKCGY